MATKATLGDWLASRTIKLHLAFLAIYSAAMPMLIGFTAEDWALIGLTPRSALIIMNLLNLVHTAGGFYMRSITSTPLGVKAK